MMKRSPVPWHPTLSDVYRPMTSRDEILARIRQQAVPAAPLPTHQGNWIQYTAAEQQFVDVLTFVGGTPLIVENSADLEATLRGLKCLAGAKQICCQIPNVGLGTFDLTNVADPHGVESVDVAILPGDFAVAENGAIWVNGQHVKHRAIYFLTQHLVLVVPRREIVHNLAQAYERLSFTERGYGLFISGPSKTADIEQSLVIGAHGPRSLTCLLVGPKA